MGHAPRCGLVARRASTQAHQLTAVALGLVLVVLVAMIGRRYFSVSAGLVAALIAAAYPGFWLPEVDMLSEPLGLVLLGVLTLLVVDLRTGRRGDGPILGIVCGLLALTRSEQLALVVVVVVPLLLTARSLAIGQRLLRIVVVGAACAVMITPWMIFNARGSRHRCSSPRTTAGSSCSATADPTRTTASGWALRTTASSGSPPAPERRPFATLAKYRSEALRNLGNNLDRVPVVVPARIGRMLQCSAERHDRLGRDMDDGRNRLDLGLGDLVLADPRVGGRGDGHGEAGPSTVLGADRSVRRRDRARLYLLWGAEIPHPGGSRTRCARRVRDPPAVSPPGQTSRPSRACATDCDVA